jgi:NAD-dependent SIR2 family protein deacetylase
MKTAIFLGAGASAAEGAPIQGNLFKDYLASVRGADKRSKMYRELAAFFRAMFNVEVKSDELHKTVFPTFEEALGVLDLSETRRESFRLFDLENVTNNSNRIRFVRQYLVLAMAKAIADKLQGGNRFHKPLVRNLQEKNLLSETVFISTNYDILIDNALASLGNQQHPGQNLDYGLEFTNFDEATRGKEKWERPAASATKLFKIHGSLNWLSCPTCNTLTLTPGIKGVIALITDPNQAVCKFCKSTMTPIIVPPTFYKDMSKVFLNIVWNRTENALRQVEHIIFCGYSFPDADMHIKYLLKRIQTNRTDYRKLRFTVINHYPGKTENQMEEEKSRYVRFLGSKVIYTQASFQEFAASPELYLRLPT